MLQQLFPNAVNLQRFLNSFLFSFVCLCAYVTDSYWIYCKLQKWIWKSDEKAVKGEKAARMSVRVCVCVKVCMHPDCLPLNQFLLIPNPADYSLILVC